MEKKENGFTDRWSSIYFFIPLFENPVIMPTAEAVCAKLTEKFGMVTELAEEQNMPSITKRKKENFHPS